MGLTRSSALGYWCLQNWCPTPLKRVVLILCSMSRACLQPLFARYLALKGDTVIKIYFIEATKMYVCSVHTEHVACGVHNPIFYLY